MHKTALPLAACLLALAAAAAHAQGVWKWRDAAGQLHIGDTAPPPGTPAKNILSSPVGGVAPPIAVAAAPAGSGAASGAGSSLDLKKQAADKQRAEKEKADKAAQDEKNAAIRRDNCQRAMTEASGIESGGRMAQMNANGEREYLNDDQRAAELRRAKDMISQNCGAAPAAQ